MRFTVYSKEGAEFPAECTSIELKEKKFVLYDEMRRESNDGFLKFDYIAAIIPDQKDLEQRKDLTCFRIHLRAGSEIKVYASAFDFDDEGVKFLWQKKDIIGKVEETRPMPDFYYVAVSEIVAIIPDDGLRSR